MKYFVEFVVSSLVTYADEVEVREEEKDGGTVYYVRLNPADIGRVIGRKGRTITAIRDLLMAAASRDGRKVGLEVVED